MNPLDVVGWAIGILAVVGLLSLSIIMISFAIGVFRLVIGG